MENMVWTPTRHLQIGAGASKMEMRLAKQWGVLECRLAMACCGGGVLWLGGEIASASWILSRLAASRRAFGMGRSQ